MDRSVHHWLRDPASLGPLAWLVLAGALFLVEGLGLPLPVEIPLVITARRVLEGDLSVGAAIALAFISTVIGNVLGYLIGRLGGRPLVWEIARRFHVSEETLLKAEDWFVKHGLKLVLGTRWINWGFAQNIWLSGMSRIPFLRFFIPMAINDLLWAVVYTWLWVRFFSLVRHAFHAYERQALWALLVLGVAGVVWWTLRHRRRTADPQPPQPPQT